MHLHTDHQPRRRRVRRTAVAIATAGLVATSLSTVSAPSTAAPKGPGAAAAKRADLQVAKLGKTPATIKYGATFNLGATVANRGRTPAKPTKLRIYLSEDKKAGKGDITGATINVEKVGPRKTRTVSGAVRVPADARGTYWVIACADATKKVTERNERNNCRVSKTKLTIDTSIKASLSGTLSFTDKGTVDHGAGRTEEWNRTHVARLSIAIGGDPIASPVFNATGSRYERTGTRTIRHAETNCLTVTTRNEGGGGDLRYTGDRFTDQVTGHFARTDLSALRLAIQIPGTWGETTTVTGQGENPCLPSTTSTSGSALTLHDVDLKEVSNTGTAITYQVTAWRGEQNTPSEWDTVTGQLVLTLQ